MSTVTQRAIAAAEAAGAMAAAQRAVMTATNSAEIAGLDYLGAWFARLEHEIDALRRTVLADAHRAHGMVPDKAIAEAYLQATLARAAEVKP